MKRFFLFSILFAVIGCVSVAQNKQTQTQVQSQAQVQTQTSVQTQILVIGDSHFYGSFGTAIHMGLHENLQGDLVHSYAGCGASVNTWMDGGNVSCGYKYRRGPDVVEAVKVKNLPEIEKLVKEYSPTVIAVELGDNMGRYNSLSESAQDLKMLREKVAQEVVRMKPVLAKAPKGCFWITPTWGCNGQYKKTPLKLAAVIDGIRDGIGETCQVIDSRESLTEKEVIGHTSDCLHLDPEKAKKWGESARDRMLMNWVR